MKRSTRLFFQNLLPLCFWIVIPLVDVACNNSESDKDHNSSLPDSSETEKCLAFPGAEGGGKYTTGGRGGKVIYVTSLDDGPDAKNTPGTLRYAITQNFPRIVAFKVAGIIELSSELAIKNPNITIAGQTAPGEGICLKNFGISIGADNIIIRYIRIRPGDEMAHQFPSDDQRRNIDGIAGRYHRNIMLDHCSFSWSTDECCSIYGCENATVQWCMIAESLNQAGHTKDVEHGMGGIWGGKNCSYHHNLVAFNNRRYPLFDHPGIYSSENPESMWRGKTDYRNNVLVYWGKSNLQGGQNGQYNIVNNYFVQRPEGSCPHRIVEIWKNAYQNTAEYPYGKWYIAGNYIADYPELSKDNWLNAGSTNKNCAIDFNFPRVPINDDAMAELRLTAPLDMGEYALPEESAQEAYSRVMAQAGASKYRDRHDLRVIGYINDPMTIPENSGSQGSQWGIIDSQNDVKNPGATDAWGTYTFISDQVPVDTDGDGMPDVWETAHGLNPKDPSDGAKVAKRSNYTNLELYLNSLVQ